MFTRSKTKKRIFPASSISMPRLTECTFCLRPRSSKSPNASHGRRRHLLGTEQELRRAAGDDQQQLGLSYARIQHSLPRRVRDDAYCVTLRKLDLYTQPPGALSSVCRASTSSRLGAGVTSQSRAGGHSAVPSQKGYISAGAVLRHRNSAARLVSGVGIVWGLRLAGIGNRVSPRSRRYRCGQRKEQGRSVKVIAIVGARRSLVV